MVEHAPPDRQRGLLEWAKACRESELIGIAEPCYAGIWYPTKDQKLLADAGIERPNVIDVLRDHHALFESLAAGPNAGLANWFLRMADAIPVRFDAIKLNESFVRGWWKENALFELTIVAALSEEHPQYSRPPKGEVSCQRDATVTFANAKSIEGVRPMPSDVAHTDRWPLDFGGIAPFLVSRDGTYYLEGEFGEVYVGRGAARLMNADASRLVRWGHNVLKYVALGTSMCSGFLALLYPWRVIALPVFDHRHGRKDRRKQ